MVSQCEKKPRLVVIGAARAARIGMSRGLSVARLRTMLHNRPTADERIARRVAAIDWGRVETNLNESGYARTGKLLAASECRTLLSLYDREKAFRKRVIMARHGYGQGEYRYLSYPLPAVVQALREAIYPRLAFIANRWREALGESAAYPPDLGKYLARCHRAGQAKPTPLILKYQRGDYNCLHQDLYGEMVFPLQLTLLLSKLGEDFNGGEFLLVETRPRRQSRGRAVVLQQGEAVIFPVHHRPMLGKRGYYRATVRHGVSPLHAGQRFTLGVIFHDAA